VTAPVRIATAPEAYEAPSLRVVGSLHELTLHEIPCLWNKTLGPPDYWTFIPIANCSP
jgi:hypothetical protein